MPTVYVTTKLEYSHVMKRFWETLDPEDRALYKQDLTSNPGIQRLKFSLLDTDGDILMQVDQNYFSPFNGFNAVFDESKGCVNYVFDGVIKLPISKETEAKVNSWPKDKPASIYIKAVTLFSEYEYTPKKAFCSTCVITKSKPKGASF